MTWINTADRLPEVINHTHNYLASQWVLISDGKSIFTDLGLWDGQFWFTANNPHPENRITKWMDLKPFMEMLYSGVSGNTTSL